jgi:hypothetical protein
MVGLYKDPTGADIFKRASSVPPTMPLDSVSSSEVGPLKRKIAELESELRNSKQVLRE